MGADDGNSNDVVVYTAIFDEYDELLDPIEVDPNVDYICFSDDPSLDSEIWTIRMVPHDQDPAVANRRIKILTHNFLPDYTYSAYIDGNIRVTRQIEGLVKGVLSDNDFAVYQHPNHDSIQEEAKACIRRKKGSSQRIMEQIEKYEAAGFPNKHPLSSNNILFRRHSSKDLIQTMEHWWSELKNESQRDQLSLPYVVWENDLDYKLLPAYRRRRYFEIYPHRPDGLKRIIWPMWLYVRFHRHNSRLYSLLYMLIRLAESTTLMAIEKLRGARKLISSGYDFSGHE